MIVYRIGPFELQAERLVASYDGNPLAFGPKVAKTLLVLAEHTGTTLSKSDLLDQIWPEGFVEEANLAQNVYVLRRAFRAHGVPAAIETVARYGYRLTLPVTRVTPSAPTTVALAPVALAAETPAVETPAPAAGARHFNALTRRAMTIATAAATIAAALLITGRDRKSVV